MRISDWSSDVCSSDLVSIAIMPAILDKCGTALSDSAQLQLQADHGIDIEAGDVRDLVERQRSLAQQLGGMAVGIHASAINPRMGDRGGHRLEIGRAHV